LAQRSRKRGQREAPVSPPTTETAEGPRPPTRSELRNEAIRSELRPLGAGERPGAVTIAALLAGFLALLNVVLYAAGVRVEDSTFAGTVGVAAVLLLAAVGMWRVQYWAVLGFEVLLGISCVVASLSLLVASSVAGAVRAGLVVAICGTLFWKLIRAMARIQMPERRRPAS